MYVLFSYGLSRDTEYKHVATFFTLELQCLCFETILYCFFIFLTVVS